MILDFLWSTDERLVLAVLIVVFVGSAWIGGRVGRRDHAPASHVGTIQTSLLGLLALLLGFSFAMAQSRYETRQTLVIDEANAIGTAYLRAQMLPAPEAQEVAEALRRYVDLRLSRLGSRMDGPVFQQALQETGRLHDYLWARAVTATRKAPTITVSLFVTALNDVIDVHGKRLAAARNHVPEIVLLLLGLVGMAALAVTGFSARLDGGRSWWPTATTGVLVAVVIVVILDLDRPRQGLITVSQQSLVDLRDSLTPARP
jgi:hypothetical protein